MGSIGAGLPDASRRADIEVFLSITSVRGRLIHKVLCSGGGSPSGFREPAGRSRQRARGREKGPRAKSEPHKAGSKRQGAGSEMGKRVEREVHRRRRQRSV